MRYSFRPMLADRAFALSSSATSRLRVMPTIPGLGMYFHLFPYRILTRLALLRARSGGLSIPLPRLPQGALGEKNKMFGIGVLLRFYASVTVTFLLSLAMESSRALSQAPSLFLSLSPDLTFQHFPRRVKSL